MDLDDDACYRALVTRDARFDGKLFIGVKTTGIYCRPICPARTPKRQNIIVFPSAAAAQEAGYRPCLRCRPETAPDCGAWRGTSNTVSRGLMLIELGVLDEESIESLAERLGVGERQLRRLFHRHLGASPVSVAQTRRVLLAKQLLHETRLPMTEVALAAGFGSLRRFNETFRTLFGRTPSALRKRRRSAVAKETDCGVTVRLRYRPPYDWKIMLSHLRACAIPGIEVVSSDRYMRTIEIGGTHGIVSVIQTEDNALQAEIHFGKLTSLPTIIARLRRLFDLAADPDAIGAHLSRDPLLAPLVAARPGIRIPGSWDGFELATRTLLGQQIGTVGMENVGGELVAAYGEPLECEPATPELTHVFPRAGSLARADLCRLGIPTQRALALKSLAVAAATDPSLLSAYGRLEGTIAQLRSLPGIDKRTAEYIGMRGLQEPNAFPADHADLLQAVSGLSGFRFLPRELLARAQRWQPWRAYAALQLYVALLDLSQTCLPYPTGI